MRGGCPRPDRHRCPPPRWNIVSDTPPACGAVRATPLVPRPELARRTVPAIASAPERCQQQVRVPRPAPGAFPGCPSTADGPGPCALRRYWGGTIWLPPGGAALTVAFGACHRSSSPASPAASPWGLSPRLLKPCNCREDPANCPFKVERANLQVGNCRIRMPKPAATDSDDHVQDYFADQHASALDVDDVDRDKVRARLSHWCTVCARHCSHSCVRMRFAE